MLDSSSDDLLLSLSVSLCVNDIYVSFVVAMAKRRRKETGHSDAIGAPADAPTEDQPAPPPRFPHIP